MKNLVKVWFRQRIKLDEYLIAGIDVLQKFVHLLLTNEQEGTYCEQAEGILDLELMMEDGYELFLQSLDKRYYLPFYWEDMFEIYSNLKKIFAILQAYSTEKRIYKPHFSFSHFFELEYRVLENMRSFFQEYLTNRKYAEELLKNNLHELKNFARLYYHGIASIGREQGQSHITSRLLEVLLEINTVNNTIQDLLQKILIGTNL
ncbi:MAG: hypothetical protein JSV89_14270 [Spirochaetaceae bacterium]|nr:MAG: hypothetical protein JSV89_14270 [Spirochaetaceae bacterium]